VKTRDLRLDVHKNSKDPEMVTGIIQANSEATDKSIEDFIKGKTGGHRGTHHVIGEKIAFGLGDQFDVEALVSAVEDTKDKE
jgi:hypothetical protein